MVTEYGSIKAGAKLDEKMQKELSGGLNIYALLLLIFGSIGTAAFLVLYVIAEFVFPAVDDFWFLMLLIIFAALLGGGIGLKILLNKNLKAVRGIDKSVYYEFFKSYFTVTETLNKEPVASAKIYNTQIVNPEGSSSPHSAPVPDNNREEYPGTVPQKSHHAHILTKPR